MAKVNAKAKFTKNQKDFFKLMKQFMKSAWTMARKASSEFGGKASDFFAESLRIIWSASFARQISLF